MAEVEALKAQQLEEARQQEEEQQKEELARLRKELVTGLIPFLFSFHHRERRLVK